MSTQEIESALDSMIQQTWKRARTTQEINDFLARRELALETVSSDEFEFPSI